MAERVWLRDFLKKAVTLFSSALILPTFGRVKSFCDNLKGSFQLDLSRKTATTLLLESRSPVFDVWKHGIVG